MENSELALMSNKIRQDIIKSIHKAGSGHPGGSLSITDILTYLYFEEMLINPFNPNDLLRDRFVLSKGHAAPALYSVLANRGYFKPGELQNLRKLGGFLQGHPEMKHTPGVDMSTGSLGQGISAAVGMALSFKLDNKENRVYTILGDGELEEGQVWEATMFAGNNHLDNLVIIVDNNNLQIDGTIQDVNSPYPIEEKFKSFRCNVIEIDGHCFTSIRNAFKQARQNKGVPTVVIANTVKGKGVSFMEDQLSWHGTAPNDQQLSLAIQELQEEALLWQK